MAAPFLSASARKALLDQALELLLDYYENTHEYRVTPVLDKVAIRDSVREFDFEVMLDPIQSINQVINSLKKYSVHTPHPKYFGLFNPRSNFPSIVSDLITAVFNPQLAAWSHSPFANEVESYLIQALGEKFGFDPAKIDGVFSGGGAEANQTAVLCALNHLVPDYASKGLFGQEKRPLIYCSSESHHSIHKAAMTSGLGNSAVRIIPVTDRLEMDLTRLKQQLERDIADGQKPLMVVATAGTTGVGAIDNLVAIGKMAKQFELWFHVDAAYGGAAVLYPELKPYLGGISEADSITFDAHKWLSVTMGTSLFICSHPDILAKTFRITADYMPKEAKDMDIVDPFSHSIQWSRRALGIKLYLSLLMFGWKGYEEMIGHQTAMGHSLRSELDASGWSIQNSSPFPVVCFTDPIHAKDLAFVPAIIQSVLGSGRSWISSYPIHGIPVMRACITNFETEERHVKELVEELNDARNEYKKIR
ncbi:pyridoxal phosphate-dependent decarboxylase family protein [Lunatibacter salilacus]|uniref:pyridoxal phosphate-dependent decarboxylase family protein n=1 Tax=Lunatibacter salilacus TaxID=2483804 RepID=UPI00131C245E|nr:aminotransferase class V-fold PLP-dependent enzyme [Lunatibacter salilacus]